MTIDEQKTELARVKTLIDQAGAWFGGNQQQVIFALMGIAYSKLRAVAEANDLSVTERKEDGLNQEQA